MLRGTAGLPTTTTTGTGGIVRDTSPTITTPNIVGTATNDNAAAGSVGQYVEAEVLIASAVTLTTATPANVTSISLTAGDWDVSGNVCTDVAGGTVLTSVESAINTTSATLPTRPGKGSNQKWDGSLTGTNLGFPVGTRRLSLSATTTVYLVTSMAFTTSTCKAFGFLGARRVR